MNFLKLFIFAFICHVTFAADDKCDIEKFTKCFSSLDSSSAQEQCNGSGDCPNELMGNIDECLFDIFDKSKNIGIDALFRYSVSCEKQQNSYCFDALKSGLLDSDSTKKCNDMASKKINQLLKFIKTKSSKEYEKLKSKIDSTLEFFSNAINSGVCNPSNFAGCFSALRSGTAEEQCKKVGKCSESVITKLNECFEYIYSASSTDSTKKINLKIFNNFFKNFNVSFTFSCENVDGEWCYDSFVKSLENKEKMKKFKNSKCGQIALENFESILQSIDDTNSEIYIQTKANVDAIKNADLNSEEDSGAFSSYPLKISSLILILLIAFLLN